MDTVNAGDGDGDDDVKADDGVPDTIDCGLGQDRVDADPVDTVLSCELRTDLTIDTPISPTDVVLFGDVDGDGLDDLVTVSTAGVVMVRRSDGVDAFADPVTWLTWSGGATDMTLGDVDGDGDKDLIGRTGTSADIGVALSSGTAFGVPATWLTAAPAGTLRAADVDGSLTDDLVIMQANGTVQEAYAEAGAFREIAVMVSLPAGSVPMFGDVDGDGLADLVLASAGRIRCGFPTQWSSAPRAIGVPRPPAISRWPTPTATASPTCSRARATGLLCTWRPMGPRSAAPRPRPLCPSPTPSPPPTSTATVAPTRSAVLVLRSP